jgi:hypothetical protein
MREAKLLHAPGAESRRQITELAIERLRRIRQVDEDVAVPSRTPLGEAETRSIEAVTSSICGAASSR